MSQRTIDIDGNGTIEMDELKTFIPPEHHDRLTEAFKEADVNKDGKLDRRELRNLWQRKAYWFAKVIVEPKNLRGDSVDGAYADEYSCFPPPIFMFSITLIMIGIFAYHTNEIIEKIGPIGINGPPPMDSVFIYDPYRRYQAWRFLTYMFVHAGWVHITSNVVMQLFLGILLEMVHKWWRVLLVYCLGVIAGSLATSITDPTVFLAGASGGVYALITAHMATVILNWKEMELPWVRVISFTAFATLDVGVALYYRYVDPIEQRIGYAAHGGGALVGLLVGIFVLRNLRPTSFEKKLWWTSLVVTIILGVIAIGWNLLYSDYFPAPRY
ncbi:unnamed protein product [Orchesella dallaii]|uniref:EF-hand domain-containing protein n=1 Tax=Orchesella dallaii TaxID=48710 RepID=A0ABP1R8A8_9HEXA